MKNDVLFYREAEVESFQWRIYQMIGIALFVFIIFIVFTLKHFELKDILSIFTLFLFLLFGIFFSEIKRIKAITVLNQNIFIDYFMMNKEKRAIIDLENLKIDFDSYSSKNGSYFQLKFTSNKTWKLNSDESWKLQDLKDIYLKIKEIKNEPLTKEEEELIKKVDDTINDKGFFST